MNITNIKHADKEDEIRHLTSLTVYLSFHITHCRLRACVQPSSTSKQSGLWLVRRYSVTFGIFFSFFWWQHYKRWIYDRLHCVYLFQVIFGFSVSWFVKTEVFVVALRSSRGRFGPTVSRECPSSDGHSAGPPLLFDNNDSVDNVHILTVGPPKPP